MHSPTTTVIMTAMVTTLLSKGCHADVPPLLLPFVSTATRKRYLWDRRRHPNRHRSSTTLLLHGNELDLDDLDKIPTRRLRRHESFQSAVRRAARRSDARGVVLKRLAREEARRKDREQRRWEELYRDKRRASSERRHRNDPIGGEERIIPSKRRGIPLLGPFLQYPPLFLGSTITLASSLLTPLQRLALKVARAQSRRLEHEGGAEAAPVVAVIDKFTDGAANPSGKRYATLASIRFLENGSVQLFGVGRAWLHDYFSVTDADSDAGLSEEEEELSKILDSIQQCQQNDNGDDNREYHDDDDDGDNICHRNLANLPVLMAEFDVFLDDSSILPTLSSMSSKRASSVHAISELYRAANRVYRIHEERKTLVAGLMTGLARLRNVRRPDRNSDVLRDLDGIGLVIGRNDKLHERTPGHERMQNNPLIKMENMGLGNFGILSTIPNLAEELMLRLEPHYGSTHREREEYKAEAASFVAFQTLEAYASPREMAKALLAPSAAERFGMAYDIMARHREELYEWTKTLSDDLADCGEECGDLW